MTHVTEVDPNDECLDFSSGTNIKNWIWLINCPDEENTIENPACAGKVISSESGFKSYIEGVADALSQYGCTCFQDNKMVPNIDVSKETGHRMPGLNGKPIDPIDQACFTLNQRFKCLDIDLNDGRVYKYNNHPDREYCSWLHAYTVFKGVFKIRKGITTNSMSSRHA